MDLIIAYVLFNIIVARFLECKRLRAGIVAHAVMFTMLLICLFALSPDDYVAYICRRIIGEGAYEKLHEAIGWWGYTRAELFIPVLVIEAVMILTGITAAVILAKRVIEAVRKIRQRPRRITAEKKKVYYRGMTQVKTRMYKIYLKNCAMLC